MSLPAPNTSWPPKPLAPLFDMVGESAAWWEGDGDALSSQYAGRVRPSQYAGGVVGAASRFFWGKPQPAGAAKRFHLPLAADLAATSATVLFDTPPTIHLAPEGGNDKAAERLDKIFNIDQYAADLLVGGESCAALGGVYGRVMWDQTVSDTPWLDWVDADSAIPEWRYGRLSAVTFVEELPMIDERHVHRLLSRYSAGRIEYGLYEGKPDNLGKPVPLPDHPTTAGMKVDSESGVNTGGRMLPAAYIPNARPVVGFRKNGQLRDFGRPDLSPDLFPLFDLLDETWTSLKRDLRLGKGRMTVPEYMLKAEGFGQGMSFDEDEEIFTPFKSRPDEGLKPEWHQPDIRVETHFAASEGIIRQVLQRANYSPRTFGMGNGNAGQVTAREIEADMESTLQTWRSKSRYWRAGQAHLAAATLEIDNALNRTGAQLSEPVKVEMVPPVQETMLDRAQTIQALDTARAISTDEKVRMIRTDWDSTRQENEIAKIKAEQGGTFDPYSNVNPDEPLNIAPPVMP